jgi:hypothetical protein
MPSIRLHGYSSKDFSINTLSCSIISLCLSPPCSMNSIHWDLVKSSMKTWLHWSPEGRPSSVQPAEVSKVVLAPLIFHNITVYFHHSGLTVLMLTYLLLFLQRGIHDSYNIKHTIYVKWHLGSQIPFLCLSYG